MRTRTALLGFLAVVVVGAAAAPVQADCSGVPMGDMSAAPNEVWNPKGGPVDVFVEGRFIQPEGCSYRFARIIVVDEYNESNSAAFIGIDENGQFRKTVQINSDRLGKDKDGRLYTISVAAVNDAGTGVADVQFRVLHNPNKH